MSQKAPLMAHVSSPSKAKHTRPQQIPDLIGLPEAAELIGVHYRTVRRWISAGLLPATRVGPKLLKIRVTDLEALAGVR